MVHYWVTTLWPTPIVSTCFNWRLDLLAAFLLSCVGRARDFPLVKLEATNFSRGHWSRHCWREHPGAAGGTTFWARVAPQSKVNEFCGCWGWDNTNLLDDMITPNIGPKSLLGILRGIQGCAAERRAELHHKRWILGVGLSEGTCHKPQAWVSKCHRIGLDFQRSTYLPHERGYVGCFGGGNLQQTDSKCIYSKGFSRRFLVSGNQHGNWKPSVLIKTSMDRVRDFSLKTQYITIFHK